MNMLTPAMARDLRYLVALWRLSVEVARPSTRPAVGDSVRTGRALRARGLVMPAAGRFTNRVETWIPTSLGVQYVEGNFRVFDDFTVQAVERAIHRLRGYR